MLSFFRRSRIGTAQQSHGRTTQQRVKCRVPPLVSRSMATKHNGPENKKKHKPKTRSSLALDDRLRHKADECDEAVEREQARLWAKLQRAEKHLPTGNVAQRSRALDRMYADLVANSAIGSFASSERGQKLIDTTTGRDIYFWMEEQRRLEKAFFSAKMRSASLWIFAPMHDVGVLVRLGRVLGVIAWSPMFVFARLMTLPLPILRRMNKWENGR
jgi:hypothetical protein